MAIGRERGLVALAMTLVACLLAAPSTSVANGPTLVIDDTGQPAAADERPPLVLSSRGACAKPRTVEEANGGPSACPEGTWPAPGGDWSPALDVATADVLELTFSDERAAVAIVGTHNFPPGLTTPPPPLLPGQQGPTCCGQPILNELLGSFATRVTTDAHRWLVDVPALDARARFGNTAIAVTTTGIAGAQDFALAIAAGRVIAVDGACSTRIYGPGEVARTCPGVKAGPLLAPSNDASRTVAAAPTVLRRAAWADGCRLLTLEVRGAVAPVRITLRAGTRSLQRWSRGVRSGPVTTTVHLRLTRTARAAALRAAPRAVTVQARAQSGATVSRTVPACRLAVVRG